MSNKETDNEPVIEGTEHNNKLWLILKNIWVSENNTNKFFLNGGEVIKLGRVVMKIVEINSELLDNQNEESVN